VGEAAEQMPIIGLAHLELAKGNDDKAGGYTRPLLSST